MSEELRVKFWGVRGSHPTPGAGTVKYGGNTASVEVDAGDKTIILDAGTGAIPLGRDLARRAAAKNRPLELILLFSHLHHDHTQGFPFFAPAYLPNARLHLFGPGVSPAALEAVLEQNQSPVTFPVGLREMASSKDIRSLRDTQAIVWDENGVRIVDHFPITGAGAKQGKDALAIRMHRSYAHPGGVYAYRIEWRGRSIVYATDTEGYIGTDCRLVKFAQGADLLIHDAQYIEAHYRGQLAGFPATQGYGHSTAAMACQVAEAARVGQLVLFHHDPAYDDATIDTIEAEARTQFKNTFAAYESLALVIPPPPLGEGLGEVPSSGMRAERRVKYAQDE